MSDSCQKASAIDLGAFLTEPQHPEWTEFRRHLLHCESCAAEVQRWTKLEQLLRAVNKEPETAHPTHPTEERLVQFHRYPESLSPEERHAIHQHLPECPVCREGLSLLTSFDFSLLRRWVDEAQPTRAADTPRTFSRLILQLAHTGLKLVEHHLTLPLLDVQEVLVPLPAYRGETGPSPPLQLRLMTGQGAIDALMVQEEDQVALTLTFLGAGQAALAGLPVLLRHQGRAVFAAQTDSAGVWRSPRVRPGLYEVSCPGIDTTFGLEVRSEGA